MAIYVGNISYRISENDLIEAFSKFGQVQSAQIITDEYSGRSKGFGFVYMKDEEEIETAIRKLNGKELKGQSLRVNRAHSRKTA